MKKLPATEKPAPTGKHAGRMKTKQRADTTTLACETSTRLELITTTAVLERPAAFPVVQLQPIRFGYFNPDAKEVFLAGSFNDWDLSATPLTRDALGDWSVELQLPRGEYRYRLLVDGEWRDHPSAQQTVVNPYGGFDAVIMVS